MIISDRLKSIASMVDKVDTLVDIGTDHAYLPIYLALNGIVKRVYAIDNKIGPLNNATKNIKNSGLENIIIPLLSDGLKDAKDIKYDAINISGMGSETIIDILSIDNLDENATLILEPQKNPELLRKFLMERNYEIVDELFIKDKNHYYPIIKAKKTKEAINYSNLEILFGPIILKKKDPLFIEFISKQIKTLEESLSKAKNKENLESKFNLLKEVLKS
ncbi:SAM-dependent methyltransferase [bacterium]|nr:SAM-dependent methyltransferase [bacterium]